MEMGGHVSEARRDRNASLEKAMQPLSNTVIARRPEADEAISKRF
jgi:hypothetical protein